MTIKVQKQRANGVLNAFPRFGSFVRGELDPGLCDEVRLSEELGSVLEAHLRVGSDGVRVFSAIAGHSRHSIH